jgi:hypothetical protein
VATGAAGRPRDMVSPYLSRGLVVGPASSQSADPCGRGTARDDLEFGGDTTAWAIHGRRGSMGYTAGVIVIHASYVAYTYT